jgi:hypothetical protein
MVKTVPGRAAEATCHHRYSIAIVVGLKFEIRCVQNPDLVTIEQDQNSECHALLLTGTNIVTCY